MNAVDPLDLIFDLVRAERDTPLASCSRVRSGSRGNRSNSVAVIALVPRLGRRDLRPGDAFSFAITRLIAGEGALLPMADLLQDGCAELSSPSRISLHMQLISGTHHDCGRHARKTGRSMPRQQILAATQRHRLQQVRYSPLYRNDDRAEISAADIRGAAATISPPPDATPNKSLPGCHYCPDEICPSSRGALCPSCGQNLLARRCRRVL